MSNKKLDKWIARQMCQRGEEMTPQEVRDTIHSIANKFRALDPNLPEDDDELLDRIINGTQRTS